MHKRQFGHGASTGISYNTHAFVRGRRLGGIALKRAFSERFEFVDGSSCSRVVVEVEVHIRIEEVLDDSKPFAVDGSRTRVFVMVGVHTL